MHGNKTLQVIEEIKNMPDKEADILEVFIIGFRAGKQSARAERDIEQSSKPPKQTA